MTKQDAASLFHQANAMRGRGKADEALVCYDRALFLRPDFIEAQHNRAGLLATLGRVGEALEGYGRVLALEPGHRPTLANLGLLHGKAGRPEEALAAYDRLLALEPGHGGALINRGLLLAHAGSVERALRSFETVLAHDPSHAVALDHAGQMLLRLHRPEEAFNHLARAAAMPAPPVSVLTGLGNVLTAFGRHGQALACYERALTVEPGNLDCLYNLGGALKSLTRFGEAEKVFSTIIGKNPLFRRVQESALSCRLEACNWAGDLSPTQIVRSLEAGHDVCSPFVMLALSDRPSDLKLCAQVHAARVAPQHADSLSKGAVYGHGKIRLGYVSADFRDHAVSNLAVHLFELHDRSRFEVFAFLLRPPEDSDQGRRLAAAFDRFVDISRLGDEQAAAVIRAHEIDIAIDLMGHTKGARTAIFSHRPAPVQASYLGFAGTMGAPCIDYIVADDIVIPDGLHDHYCEKIVRLPHSFMVRDTANAVGDGAMTRTQAGLPERAVVFCNFGGASKITPAVFALWMRILSRVDDGVLWLSALNADARENLCREAMRLGIDSGRIVFAGQTPHLNDHLSRQRLADIFLDTMPYGAHATASDALWAGVPVLTCPGTTFPGRVAASLLTALEMPDLIFETVEDYEAAAVGYALDPPSLQALKDRLRTKAKTTPLFDMQRFVKDFETALVLMHERHRTGMSPDHIRIADMSVRR